MIIINQYIGRFIYLSVVVGMEIKMGSRNDVEELDEISVVGEICSNCGREINPENNSENPDGEIICESCFKEKCFLCDNCGSICYLDDAFFGLNNETLCEDCWREIYYNCENCDTICYLDDLHEGLDGEFLCQDCWDSHYNTCQDCGTVFRITEMYESPAGMICERCFDENYFMCCNCDNIYDINESCEDPNGDLLCQDCFYDVCFVCDECGETFFRNDYGGDGMCISCYDHEESEIEDHEPQYFPQIPLATPEIECENGNLLYTGDFPDGIVNGIVRDGSLNDSGREFHPRPLKIEEEDIYEILKTITDTLDNNGWEATPSCGCHIHFNANYMNESEVIQIWKSYLSIQPFLDLIVDKRRINDYTCSPLKKSDIQGRKSLDEMIYKTKDEHIIDDKKCEKYSSERYAAVNFHSYNFRRTIEVRLLEGTLDPEIITNWIYLNNNIIQYTRKFGNPKGIITFNKFLDIASNGNHDLKNYIKKRTKETFDNLNEEWNVQLKKNLVEIDIFGNKLMFTNKNMIDLDQ